MRVSSAPDSDKSEHTQEHLRELRPMKRIASAVLLASASVLGLAACSSEAPAAKLVGNTVDNYMLADGSGMGHILRYDTHTPAVVLASYVNGDETSRATAKALMALRTR